MLDHFHQGGRIGSIALVGAELYFVDAPSFPAQLYRVPAAGGAPVLIADPVRGAEVVAADAQYLYSVQGPSSAGPMYRYVR